MTIATTTGPRVAYLLGRYPTVSNPFVYREIDRLQASGISLDVFALSRSAGPDHGILESSTVRAVPTPSTVLLADAIPRDLISDWLACGGRKKDIRRAGWLARRWRRSGVSVVHAHFLGFSAAIAALACAAAEIPLVITVHARGILVPDSLAHFSLARAATVLTISAHTCALVRERGGRKSQVIPIPIAAHAPTPRSDGPLHILTVARAVPKKGYPVLRAAIAQLGVPVRWTVIGATEAEVGGPMRGLRALGPVGFEAVEACYAAGVDIFALACQTAADGDEDGIPVAILEAMARGVPVVTTAVGGIAELIITEENGLVLPTQNVPAMAAALERLAGDADLRDRLGSAGRQHVQAHRRPEAQVAALVRCLGTAHRSRPA
jgi:glycosyltransferase involved in cell wall biosynthesis